MNHMLQRQCDCGTCESCARNKPQRRPNGGMSVAPPNVHEALRSSGRPLDAATRAFFEPRFGHDFSRVRVHDGEAAARSAHALNAHAYTAGRDIVFSAGRYAPATREGKKLIAHELAHTIQQAPVIARDADIIKAPPLDLGHWREYKPKFRDHVPQAPTISPPPIPMTSTVPLPSPCPAAAKVTADLKASDVVKATEDDMQQDINLAKARSAGKTTPMSNSLLKQADSAIRAQFGRLLPSGRDLFAKDAVTTVTPAQFAQTRVPDAAAARERVAAQAIEVREDFLRSLCITDAGNATLQSVVGDQVIADKGIDFVREFQGARIGGQTSFPSGSPTAPKITLPDKSRNMGHIVVHEAMHFFVSDAYRKVAESDARLTRFMMEGGAEFLARNVINAQLADKPDFKINTGAYAMQFGYVADYLMRGGVDAFALAYFQGHTDLIGLPVQPKLEVSEPGDALEREADHMADAAMSADDAANGAQA
jgi:hypothetical protein